MKKSRVFALGIGSILLIATTIGGSASAGAVCTITGTNGPDVLDGTPGIDHICGLGGNDIIRGNGGGDNLEGNDGNDKIFGGDGPDFMIGGNGNDKATPGEGSDYFDGQTGIDTALFDDSPAAIIATAGGIATGYGTDGVPNVENLVGSKWNDDLTGSALSNKINAGKGDDHVYNGGGGVDTLIGGYGMDMLHADDGTADDTMRGGNGPSGAMDTCIGEPGDVRVDCEL